MSDQNEKVLDHDYDGIQEFDNPLPAWWLATFFITIIFGFLYWIHYEFGGGTNQWNELKADMAQIERLHKANGGGIDREEDLTKLAGIAEVETRGQTAFAAKCAVCHGPQLQGLIGPNLTDEYWINGQGKLTDISSVIRKGVLDKGMPPWEGQMPDEDIKALVIYIAKNLGTNPPNPKGPQGEKVVR